MTDPVCGQTVDPLRARAVAIYAGKRYYFCSAAHRVQFTAAPEKYVATDSPLTPVPVLAPPAPTPAPTPKPTPTPTPTPTVKATPRATPTAAEPTFPENDPTPLPRPMPTYSLADAPLGPVPPVPTLDPPILPLAGIPAAGVPETGVVPQAPPAGPRLLRLAIGGLSTRDDGDRVRRALERVRGVASVTLDPVTEIATLTCDDGLEADTLVEAVTAAGYEATLRRAPRATDPDVAAPRLRDLRRRALVTSALALGALPLGLLGGRIGGTTALLVAVGALVDALGAFALAGPILARIVLARRRRALAAATALVSASLCFLAACLELRTLGAGAAASAIAILAAALVTLWLDERAEGDVSHLLAELPQPPDGEVRRIRAGEGVDRIPLDTLALGELVQVGEGEEIPVDAMVRLGEITVDESALRAEALPLTFGPGDAVLAGGRVLHGTAVLEMRRAGRNAAVARMRAAIVEAPHAPSPLARLAARAAQLGGPVAAVLAVGVVIGRLAGDAPLALALASAGGVLAAAPVIALLGAASVASALATGRAARRGVLFRTGEALERAAEMDALVIDKRTALTTGTPKIEAHGAVPGGDEGRVVALAASAQRGVDTPLARAVCLYAELRGFHAPPTERLNHTPGLGTTAQVAESTVVVGSRRLLEREGVPLGELETLNARVGAQGRTVVYVAIDGRLCGALVAADELRPGATDALADLDALGIEITIMTGDALDAAQDAARRLGVTRVRAELRPEEKKAAIADLRRPGHTIGAVGDGLHDAPALAAADVAIALAGIESALEAGAVGVVVLRGDLGDVAGALTLARATRQTIVRNLTWAAAQFGVCAGAAAVAPLSTLTPWFVAVGAASVTYLVFQNSRKLLHG